VKSALYCPEKRERGSLYVIQERGNFVSGQGGAPGALGSPTPTCGNYASALSDEAMVA
jgi:hypothetical protein